MCVLCEKADFMIETMESLWPEQDINKVAEEVYADMPNDLKGAINLHGETVTNAIRLHILSIAAIRHSIKHKVDPNVVMVIFKEHLRHQIQKSLLEDLSTEEGQERILKGLFKRLFGVDLE